MKAARTVFREALHKWLIGVVFLGYAELTLGKHSFLHNLVAVRKRLPGVWRSG